MGRRAGAVPESRRTSAARLRPVNERRCRCASQSAARSTSRSSSLPPPCQNARAPPAEAATAMRKPPEPFTLMPTDLPPLSDSADVEILDFPHELVFRFEAQYIDQIHRFYDHRATSASTRLSHHDPMRTRRSDHRQRWAHHLYHQPSIVPRPSRYLIGRPSNWLTALTSCASRAAPDGSALARFTTAHGCSLT